VILRALLYGLLGMLVENLFTGLSAVLEGDKRAPTRSYLWMPVVWAAGGVAFELVARHLTHAWYRPLEWTAAIYGLEFVSGMALRFLLGVVPWDYRPRPGSLLWGTVNWRYLPYWLVLGLGVDPALRWVAHVAAALARS
jgi:hypothetical protein